VCERDDDDDDCLLSFLFIGIMQSSGILFCISRSAEGKKDLIVNDPFNNLIAGIPPNNVISFCA